MATKTKPKESFQCQSGNSYGYHVEIRSATEEPLALSSLIVGRKWKGIPVKFRNLGPERSVFVLGNATFPIGDYVDPAAQFLSLMPLKTAQAVEAELRACGGALGMFETRLVECEYKYDVKITSETPGETLDWIGRRFVAAEKPQ